MKLFIFGYKGQLGHDLQRLAPRFTLEAAGADLPECDLTVFKSVSEALDGVAGADVVINAAEYTAVDRAETDAERAFAVNRDGAAHVARACRERSIPMIHVSTDYVFSGMKTSAYQPSDPVQPTSVYGASKAEGEAAVRRYTDSHAIVRTAWLFGLHGPNFVKTIIRLAREREQLRVLDDQIGCPTYSGDLAGALLEAATAAALRRPIWGTYHFCNEGAVTWYAFARRIIVLARSHEPLIVKEIMPVLTSQYQQAARRPPCAILDCTSFEQTFAIKRRSWDAALKEMIAGLYVGS